MDSSAPGDRLAAFVPQTPQGRRSAAAGGRAGAYLAAAIAFSALPAICAPEERVCCQPEGPIDLASCSALLCSQGRTLIALRVDEGCVKLEDATNQSCRPIELAGLGGRPLPADLTMIVGGPATVGNLALVVRVAEPRAVKIPPWATTVEFRGTGVSDATFATAGKVPPRVTLVPGQQVVISARSDSRNPIDVDLHSEAGDVHRRLTTGADQRVGAFPLGRYELRLAASGFAPIRDVLRLADPSQALKRAYTLRKGACLVVPIDDSALGRRPRLTAALELLPAHEYPITIRDGAITSGEPDAASKLPDARFCDLQEGRYRLTFTARGVQDETREAHVAGETRLPTVRLVAAISGEVVVQGEDGTPLAGVAATFGWTDADGARGIARRQSGADGTIPTPGLQQPVTGTLRLEREGYCTATTIFGSADRTVVVLKAAGGLRGRLDKESCDRDGVAYQVDARAGDQASGYVLFARGAPVDCEFSVSIADPSTYRVRVTAPDAVPFEATFESDGRLRRDLGVIHLDDGEPLTVVVTARSAPVAGAVVTLVAENVTATTDERGEATFKCLHRGTEAVEIRVEHAAHGAVLKREAPDLNRKVHVELPRGGRVFGRVVADDGRPDVGRSILAVGPDATFRSSATDGSGLYEFAPLGPGRWQLSLQVRGDDRGLLTTSTGATRLVELEEGQEAEIDFVPAFEVRARMTGLPPIDGRTAIAAVNEAGYSLTITSDDPREFSAVLPAAGFWRFSVGGASAVADLRPPCPCVLDLDFGRPAR